MASATETAVRQDVANGPSKFDLEHSLFRRSGQKRQYVKFVIGGRSVYIILAGAIESSDTNKLWSI
jgi:hypothetical protein